MFVRMLQVLAIHILVGALAVGVLVLLTQNQSALDLEALGVRITRGALERRLGEVRSAMMIACLIAVGWSALVAMLWSWFASRAEPSNSAQERRYTGGWAALYLLALAGTGPAGWAGLWRTRLSALLDPMTLWIGLAVSVGAVLIAYVAATALTAPSNMRVAVPFAEFFYTLFRRGRR